MSDQPAFPPPRLKIGQFILLDQLNTTTLSSWTLLLCRLCHSSAATTTLLFSCIEGTPQGPKRAVDPPSCYNNNNKNERLFREAFQLHCRQEEHTPEIVAWLQSLDQ